MTKIDESRPFLPVNIAVMTVSDTRSAADDRSGDTLVARIEGAGHVLADRRIVADDIDVIGARTAGTRSCNTSSTTAPGPATSSS